ncbi:FAD-dependent oxidoreductase [Sporosarcina sp. 179-K 3D1 HS]|uniref:FAD-dependent oxidoreductase n=1 Tax=Sporosarcina sp. 179-K 3D1 HS TaxID=3232169 RepID=UPI00399FEC20
MKIVIVGGVAGGSTVASQIRRAVPESEITLFGRDPFFGYGTCGMPYVIGGLIEDKSKVAGPSPEKFAEKRDIIVRLEHDVLSIDRKAKIVFVRNMKTGVTFHEPYDKLVLSPGGYPKVPKLEGLGDLPLFTLKSYEQMEEILDFISREKPTSCAVIGGGFIGIELAENFVHRGIETAVILRGDRVMTVLDPELSDLLGTEMKENGVTLFPEDEIERVEGKRLIMKSGAALEVDFIAATIGIELDTKLANDAGLEIGPTKAVSTNRYRQTDDPDIYVIGDAAEGVDWFTGKPKTVMLSWHAHRESYIVARHIAGKPIEMYGLLGTTITKLFSLTAGSTGHSAASLEDEGIEFSTSVYEGGTNAGYYFDHGWIHLRVHYDPASRRILGAQAVGTKGVDKRIDVIATAIMGNLTVDDLAALELCYSPAYSSPKDPVNMVGYKAE